ncbi:MAG: phosphatase PAP2 family protein [Gemmatimonadota bacterium]|nr:phosphatase PAP2 family protein [Gemmatimonadota bacterium]
MPRRPTSLVLAVLAAAAVAAAIALDRWAFATLVSPGIYDRDLGRLLRVAGFLPTWLLASLAIGLHDRGAAVSLPWRGWRRGATVVAAAAVAGAAAEVLKLLVRRERPLDHAGAYVFRAWSDRPFSTAGLGMPSSHTLVAFGAAAALGELFPRTRWVWYGLAAGCGLSRVLAQAHFLSDVVVAAVVGTVIGIWLGRGGRAAAAR